MGLSTVGWKGIWQEWFSTIFAFMPMDKNWTVRGYMQRLDAADQILVIYNLLVLVLVLLAPREIPSIGLVLVFHLVVQSLLLRQSKFIPTGDMGKRSSPAMIYRHWLPILLIIPFYSEATYISHYFINGSLDPWLVAMDERIFGTDLNQFLAHDRPVWLNELFHGIYFSYYGLMIFPAVLLYRKSPTRFRHYLAGLILLMTIHNFLFIFIPAGGPVAFRAEFFTQGVIFIPLMDWIYSWGDYAGAAFPSAHVAASLFIFMSLRHQFRRRGQTLFAIWVGAIFVSTVYCAYHYGVDVLAGLLSGLMFYGIYLKWPWLTYKPQQPAGGTHATTDGLSVPSAPDIAP